MGRDTVELSGVEVVGSGSSKVTVTARKETFQNCIARRLEKLQQLRQFNVKEEGNNMGTSEKKTGKMLMVVGQVFGTKQGPPIIPPKPGTPKP